MQQPKETFAYRRIKIDTNRLKIAKNTNNIHQNRTEWFTNYTYCVPSQNKEKKRRSWMKLLSKRVESTLKSQNSTKKTLLLEFHGGVPSLRNLVPFIQKWRRLSHEHEKRFFAFTVVRDPIPYSVSYFNMFHFKCTHNWCEHEQYMNWTQDNLLKSLKPNRQCFFLTHLSSIAGMHPSFYDKCRVLKNDCKNIYNIMKDNLDWVGTTENLSFDTIPLLSRLLDYDYSTLENKKVAVKSKQELSRMKLNTTLGIRAFTELDQELYDNVRESYTLDKTIPGFTDKNL